LDKEGDVKKKGLTDAVPRTPLARGEKKRAKWEKKRIK